MPSFLHVVMKLSNNEVESGLTDLGPQSKKPGYFWNDSGVIVLDERELDAIAVLL